MKKYCKALSQAKYFTEAMKVTDVLLAKLDRTAKDKIVLAICDEIKLPILYIGTSPGVGGFCPLQSLRFFEALFAREG